MWARQWVLSEIAPGLLDRVTRRRASSCECCHRWLLGTAVPVHCCGERRVLRRLAGRDGSQGTSADNEVAVGQQPERESFGRRDEPEPGPTACGEFVTTLSLGAAEEPAGVESFDLRDEPEPGPTACVEVERHKSLPERGRRLQHGPRDDRGTGTVGLQRCRVDVVVVVVVVETGAESVSGCSGRPPNTGPTAGTSGKERPTVVRVRRAVTRSVV